MLKITVNKKQMMIPSSWYELSTEKYIKLNNLIALYRNEETGEVNVDGELLFQKIAQSILDMTRDEIMSLDYKIIIAIKASFGFLNQPMPEPKIVKNIKYKEHIIKISDFSGITFGQFADIQQIMGADKKDELKLISKIIDLYEPKNIFKLRFKEKKIDISDEQKIKILRDLPCTDFNNLSFFLFGRMRTFMRNSARSLNLMAVRMNAGTALRAAGVIIHYSWLWLKTKLTRSKKPQI
jgi:hypothetical protein